MSKAEVASREGLTLAYMPSVAEPCKAIAQNPEAAYLYTTKSNITTVVSDGSAILGPGNIGPLAAMPAMGRRSVLFKEFGGVDAFPICLGTQDTEETIETVVHITPAFGGINLGDIVAPRCFEIKEALKERLDIPIFYDDQHGTAIVVLAGAINALRVIGRRREGCRVVVNGAGSAGVAITKLLLTYSFSNITACDGPGILRKGTEGLNWMQEKMMDVTNLGRRADSLVDATKGMDILIGVSVPGIVTSDMVASMDEDAVIFTMANPVPEATPGLAKIARARVVGTGRSDFPNQVSNVVVFFGILKGALERRTTTIMEEIKLAAVNTITGLVDEKSLSESNILPEVFDPRVARTVSQVVKDHI